MADVGISSSPEPLWVRPKVAAVMLDCGVTRVYELMERGELEHCLDGAARKILTASIKSFIERTVKAQEGKRVREWRGSRIGKARKNRLAPPRPPRPPSITPRKGGSGIASHLADS
jgi:hypothetical protein